MKIFLPNMSDHAYPLAGVMRGMGIDAEVLPEPNDESLAVGLSLCRGRECLPCFLCIGDMIRKCRELGSDVKDAAFFMPITTGSCRFGQYHLLQKQVLAEQGFRDVQFISPSDKDSYRLFGKDPLTLRKRAWQAILATDLLTRVLHEHRPYELEKGSADLLYHRCLDLLVQAGEAGCGNEMVKALTEITDRFQTLLIDRTEPRPLIGVLGEIYLLLNQPANLFLVRAVEAAGGEVLQGTFIDYIYYVDWRRTETGILFGDYLDFLKAEVTDQYQRLWHRRLRRPLEPVLRHAEDAPIAYAMNLLRPHYHPILGTEAVLTMGRALDLFHHRVSGFINILPFSCMPGTLVAAMAPVIREQMNGIPWLDLAFDGQKDTNVQTRLEAFMHQALQFHRRVVLPQPA